MISSRQPQEILNQLENKTEQFKSTSKDLEKLSKKDKSNSIQTIVCKNSIEIEKELLNVYLLSKNNLYSFGNYDIWIDIFNYQALKIRKIRKEKNIILNVKALTSQKPKLYKDDENEQVIFDLKKQFNNSSNYILFNSEVVCVHTALNNELKCTIIKD